MFNPKIADKIHDHIKTLCNTSINVTATLDIGYEELTKRLDEIVVDLAKHYDLGDIAVDNYRQTIKDANGEFTEAASDTTYQDAEDARDMVLALCDKLDDPKQIMAYVRAAVEVTNVWFSEQ